MKLVPLKLTANFLVLGLWSWRGIAPRHFGALRIVSARSANDFERALRDLSLIDPLTELQNRRGFYLLG